MGSSLYPYDSSSLLDLLRSDRNSPLAPDNPFGNLAALGSTPPAPAGTPFASSLTDFLTSYPTPAPTPNALTAAVKRKVYFAFDFDDLIRVNNVRQVGKIGPREQQGPRSFYDRSIWESRDIENEDGLKNLMRRAVQFSSAVCVLVGAKTYLSRWVKYEIARAVIDERGLLAVQINGINHHLRKMPDRRGISPLHWMGVFHATNGNFGNYHFDSA